MLRPFEWTGRSLRLLDQTRLPRETVVLELACYEEVVEAIRALRVRGAPAIGIAGAYALALAARQGAAHLALGAEAEPGPLIAWLREAAREIAGARPTAVNLPWAVRRALRAVEGSQRVEEVLEQVLGEAQRIQQEQEEADREIARLGAELLPQGATVLTHCNTGSLATGGYGTALGVVRTAWEAGKLKGVVATETRPLLQGARLTAWELAQAGVPVTLIVDGAAGALMARGEVGCVVVGADRVAANGDAANKVGTYPLAVLAHAHALPFYVAAPRSTIDLATPSGDAIPIEERPPQEVTCYLGQQSAPEGIAVRNPAFDITPACYVTAIITEGGVVRPPYAEGLRALFHA